MYLAVRPNEDYSLLGTFVVLNKEHTYAAIPASNQPLPEKETHLFLLFSGNGDWTLDEYDLEHCIGFMLARKEVEIIEENIQEKHLFEKLKEINK